MVLNHAVNTNVIGATFNEVHGDQFNNIVILEAAGQYISHGRVQESHLLMSSIDDTASAIAERLHSRVQCGRGPRPPRDGEDSNSTSLSPATRQTHTIPSDNYSQAPSSSADSFKTLLFDITTIQITLVKLTRLLDGGRIPVASSRLFFERAIDSHLRVISLIEDVLLDSRGDPAIGALLAGVSTLR